MDILHVDVLNASIAACLDKIWYFPVVRCSLGRTFGPLHLEHALTIYGFGLSEVQATQPCPNACASLRPLLCSRSCSNAYNVVIMMPGVTHMVELLNMTTAAEVFTSSQNLPRVSTCPATFGDLGIHGSYCVREQATARPKSCGKNKGRLRSSHRFAPGCEVHFLRLKKVMTEAEDRCSVGSTGITCACIYPEPGTAVDKVGPNQRHESAQGRHVQQTTAYQQCSA